VGLCRAGLKDVIRLTYASCDGDEIMAIHPHPLPRRANYDARRTESVQTLLEQNAHLTQSVEHLTQSVETWLKQISETPNIGASRADRSAEKRGARQNAGGSGLTVAMGLLLQRRN
jgi:hypothetical protein